MTSITGKKAFTLMEMLIVLAVITLLLGISIPFVANFTKGAKLKTAAKDVFAILNTARNLSLTYRKNYSIIFDTSVTPHAYYIIDEDENVYRKKYSLPSSISFSVSDGRSTFSSTGGLATGSNSIAIFDSKGASRTITISSATGRIKISQ